MVAWDTACKPKDQGGLGIIDIQNHNDALLMKFLDKFYNNAEIPWVSLTWTKFHSNEQTPPQVRSPVGSFWSKEVMKLFDKYKSFALCCPNRGNSVLFWADIWVDQAMKDKFPQLFSFTRKPKCSVRFFLSQQMDRLFSPLPLPQLASSQLEEVYQILQTRNWDESLHDSWNYN